MTGKSILLATVYAFPGAAAVVSPWWLPVVKATSEYAGMWLPILGCAWLLIQMVVFLVKQMGGFVLFCTAIVVVWVAFIAAVISNLEFSWFAF